MKKLLYLLMVLTACTSETTTKERTGDRIASITGRMMRERLYLLVEFQPEQFHGNIDKIEEYRFRKYLSTDEGQRDTLHRSYFFKDERLYQVTGGRRISDTVTINYDLKGRIIKVERTDSGRPYMIEQLEYDTAGRCIKREEWAYYYTKKVSNAYIYNKTGDTIDILNNDEYATRSRIVFSVLADNIIAKEMSAEDSTYATSVIRRFNKSDLMADFTVFAYDAEILGRYETRTYDRYGNVTQVVGKVRDDKYPGLQPYNYNIKYSYDEKGNWVTRIIQEGETHEITTRKITYK